MVGANRENTFQFVVCNLPVVKFYIVRDSAGARDADSNHETEK